MLNKEESLKVLNKIKDTHNKYKTSYFWTPGENSAKRREQEELNTFEKTYKLWNEDEVKQKIEMRQSCKHVYVNRDIFINNEKKTLRAITSLIKITEKSIKNEKNQAQEETNKPKKKRKQR